MPTSLAGRRPAGRSSSTSRSSTIASADTRRWGTYPQPNTNGKTLDYLSTFRGELQSPVLLLIFILLLILFFILILLLSSPPSSADCCRFAHADLVPLQQLILG